MEWFCLKKYQSGTISQEYPQCVHLVIYDTHKQQEQKQPWKF